MEKTHAHEAIRERCFRYLLRTKIKSIVSSLTAAQEVNKLISKTICDAVITLHRGKVVNL